MLKTEFNNELLILPSKEFAYLLGYIWADGYLSPQGTAIRLEIVTEDGNIIDKVISSTGKWCRYKRIRKLKDGCNRKEITTFHVSGKELRNFLEKYNYSNKSGGSFEEVYNFLSDENKILFLRGYFDGDGCFYVNHKLGLYQFHVSSVIKQDWEFLKSIFIKFNANPHIYKRNQLRKNGNINNSSKLQLSNKKDIVKVFDNIYKNFEKDGIGLNRKFEKYMEIKTKIKN